MMSILLILSLLLCVPCAKGSRSWSTSGSVLDVLGHVWTHRYRLRCLSISERGSAISSCNAVPYYTPIVYDRTSDCFCYLPLPPRSPPPGVLPGSAAEVSSILTSIDGLATWDPLMGCFVPSRPLFELRSGDSNVSFPASACLRIDAVAAKCRGRDSAQTLRCPRDALLRPAEAQRAIQSAASWLRLRDIAFRAHLVLPLHTLRPSGSTRTGSSDSLNASFPTGRVDVVADVATGNKGHTRTGEKERSTRPRLSDAFNEFVAMLGESESALLRAWNEPSPQRKGTPSRRPCRATTAHASVYRSSLPHAVQLGAFVAPPPLRSPLWTGAVWPDACQVIATGSSPRFVMDSGTSVVSPMWDPNAVPTGGGPASPSTTPTPLSSASIGVAMPGIGHSGAVGSRDVNLLWSSVCPAGCYVTGAVLPSSNASTSSGLRCVTCGPTGSWYCPGDYTARPCGNLPALSLPWPPTGGSSPNCSFITYSLSELSQGFVAVENYSLDSVPDGGSLCCNGSVFTLDRCGSTPSPRQCNVTMVNTTARDAFMCTHEFASASAVANESSCETPSTFVTVGYVHPLAHPLADRFIYGDYPSTVPTTSSPTPDSSMSPCASPQSPFSSVTSYSISIRLTLNVTALAMDASRSSPVIRTYQLLQSDGGGDKTGGSSAAMFVSYLPPAAPSVLHFFRLSFHDMFIGAAATISKSFTTGSLQKLPLSNATGDLLLPLAITVVVDIESLESFHRTANTSCFSTATPTDIPSAENANSCDSSSPDKVYVLLYVDGELQVYNHTTVPLSRLESLISQRVEDLFPGVFTFGGVNPSYTPHVGGRVTRLADPMPAHAGVVHQFYFQSPAAPIPHAAWSAAGHAVDMRRLLEFGVDGSSWRSGLGNPSIFAKGSVATALSGDRPSSTPSTTTTRTCPQNTTAAFFDCLISRLSTLQNTDPALFGSLRFAAAFAGHSSAQLSTDPLAMTLSLFISGIALTGSFDSDVLSTTSRFPCAGVFAFACRVFLHCPPLVHATHDWKRISQLNSTIPAITNSPAHSGSPRCIVKGGNPSIDIITAAAFASADAFSTSTATSDTLREGIAWLQSRISPMTTTCSISAAHIASIAAVVAALPAHLPLHVLSSIWKAMSPTCPIFDAMGVSAAPSSWNFTEDVVISRNLSSCDLDSDAEGYSTVSICESRDHCVLSSSASGLAKTLVVTTRGCHESEGIDIASVLPPVGNPLKHVAARLVISQPALLPAALSWDDFLSYHQSNKFKSFRHNGTAFLARNITGCESSPLIFGLSYCYLDPTGAVASVEDIRAAGYLVGLVSRSDALSPSTAASGLQTNSGEAYWPLSPLPPDILVTAGTTIVVAAGLRGWLARSDIISLSWPTETVTATFAPELEPVSSTSFSIWSVLIYIVGVLGGALLLVCCTVVVSLCAAAVLYKFRGHRPLRSIVEFQVPFSAAVTVEDSCDNHQISTSMNDCHSSMGTSIRPRSEGPSCSFIQSYPHASTQAELQLPPRDVTDLQPPSLPLPFLNSPPALHQVSPLSNATRPQRVPVDRERRRRRSLFDHFVGQQSAMTLSIFNIAGNAIYHSRSPTCPPKESRAAAPFGANPLDASPSAELANAASSRVDRSLHQMSHSLQRSASLPWDGFIAPYWDPADQFLEIPTSHSDVNA